jgi:hypothetical protein
MFRGHLAFTHEGRQAPDLPIEQPAKFEFVIDLKTGKALGRLTTLPRWRWIRGARREPRRTSFRKA